MPFLCFGTRSTRPRKTAAGVILRRSQAENPSGSKVSRSLPSAVDLAQRANSQSDWYRRPAAPWASVCENRSVIPYEEIVQKVLLRAGQGERFDITVPSHLTVTMEGGRRETASDTFFSSLDQAASERGMTLRESNRPRAAGLFTSSRKPSGRPSATCRLLRLEATQRAIRGPERSRSRAGRPNLSHGAQEPAIAAGRVDTLRAPMVGNTGCP